MNIPQFLVAPWTAQRFVIILVSGVLALVAAGVVSGRVIF